MHCSIWQQEFTWLPCTVQLCLIVFDWSRFSPCFYPQEIHVVIFLCGWNHNTRCPTVGGKPQHRSCWIAVSKSIWQCTWAIHQLWSTTKVEANSEARSFRGGWHSPSTTTTLPVKQYLEHADNACTNVFENAFSAEGWRTMHLCISKKHSANLAPLTGPVISVFGQSKCLYILHDFIGRELIPFWGEDIKRRVQHHVTPYVLFVGLFRRHKAQGILRHSDCPGVDFGGKCRRSRYWLRIDIEIDWNFRAQIGLSNETSRQHVHASLTALVRCVFCLTPEWAWMAKSLLRSCKIYTGVLVVFVVCVMDVIIYKLSVFFNWVIVLVRQTNWFLADAFWRPSRLKGQWSSASTSHVFQEISERLRNAWAELGFNSQSWTCSRCGVLCKVWSLKEFCTAICPCQHFFQALSHLQ